MMNCRRQDDRQFERQQVILVTNGVLLDVTNYLQLREEGVKILVAPV
ncbi:hypothetical protein ACFLXM_00025 [Chloroflexota bacterium]